jgi:hypothetical protein
MPKANSKNRSFLVFIFFWAFVAIAGVTWALATPLGAAPDEPAHIIKAASVAHGQLLGNPTSEAAVTEVFVPQSVAQAGAWPCYAFHEEIPADCIPQTKGGLQLVSTTTSAGLYNPVYYAVVGWPSLLFSDGATVVYVMRIISAILVSFFLAIAWHALLKLNGKLLGGLTFFAAVTPMVLFLTGVVNPNGLEIASGAAFLSSLLVFLNSSNGQNRNWPWLVAITTSGVFLASSRGISPFWLVLFVALAILTSGWAAFWAKLQTRGFIVSVVAVSLAALSSVAWVLSTSTLNAMGTFPGAGEVSPLRAFFTMVFQKSADPGLIGVFGWLDTFPPPLVYAIWSFLILSIITATLVAAKRKGLIVSGIAIASFIATPALIQAASVQQSGFIWQGRYSLAVMIAMLIICSTVLAQALQKVATHKLSGRILIVTSILVFAGHLTAFVSTLGRYVVGNSGAIFAALGSGKWSPPLGGKVLLALLVVSLLGMLSMWWWTTRMGKDLAEKGSPEYQVAMH